ncbi:unnamed protein product [Coccothraustes coccothraustes]
MVSVGSGRSRDGIPNVFFPSPSPWLPAFVLLLILALCLALAAALRLRRKSQQEISEEQIQAVLGEWDTPPGDMQMSSPVGINHRSLVTITVIN